MNDNKKNNNTIDVAKQSKTVPSDTTNKRGKVRPLLEEYYSVISGKKEILNTRKLDSLCEYLLKCAQTCDGITDINEYLSAPEAPFKVEVRTFNKWVHKYPQLEEASNELKEAIGSKLRKKVLKYEIAPTLIHKDLNLYCERYKKLFEWESALKNKDADKFGDRIVVVERIKDCPSVKPCEKDESND